MRVAHLQIRNFRGVREGSVRFGRHTVLVGAGNVGKTTIIEALALLFGRDRLVRELTEHDFSGSCPAPADRIELVATITDFSGSQDPLDHSGWFRDGRGVPKFLDEKGTVHASQDQPGWKLACQVGFQARFDQDALQVETVRYFHDHDGDIDPFDGDGGIVQFPAPLVKEMGFYLMRANRTWDGVISFGSELFRRIVTVAKGQPAAAVLAERDRLRNPATPIEEDAKLQPLIASINAELARLMPRSPKVGLRVSSTDSRGVLDSIVAHFLPEAGVGIPASRQGSGLVSLQALLLLLELGRHRASAMQGFLMAVEEPELHVPAPSQGRLVRRIQALSSQSIVTTHATAVAAAADPTALLVLRNEGGRLIATPLLEAALSDAAPAYMRKYFFTGRYSFIAALLHESVLVPEGRSEASLLSAIAYALDLKQTWTESSPPSFALEVGVVPTEDAKVVETYPLVARVHSRASCLVDGDKDGDRYARELGAQPAPPAQILQWPPGWHLEHVIGWIIEADPERIVPKLAELDGPPTSAASLVALLASGKTDPIVHETVACAIADTSNCAVRANELLVAMAKVCSGKPTPRFKLDAAKGTLVFSP